MMTRRRRRRSLTFGETGGVEGERRILGDLVEVWDVGDMNGFESHMFGEKRRREKHRERRREFSRKGQGRYFSEKRVDGGLIRGGEFIVKW